MIKSLKFLPYFTISFDLKRTLDFCVFLVIIYFAKHLLLKAYARLTPKDYERLMVLFQISPVLGDAYELKELLRQIYALKDYDDAGGLWLRILARSA